MRDFVTRGVVLHCVLLLLLLRSFHRLLLHQELFGAVGGCICKLAAQGFFVVLGRLKNGGHRVDEGCYSPTFLLTFFRYRHLLRSSEFRWRLFRRPLVLALNSVPCRGALRLLRDFQFLGLFHFSFDVDCHEKVVFVLVLIMDNLVVCSLELRWSGSIEHFEVTPGTGVVIVWKDLYCYNLGHNSRQDYGASGHLRKLAEKRPCLVFKLRFFIIAKLWTAPAHKF